jgi:ribosomal protein S28E/S33
LADAGIAVTRNQIICRSVFGSVNIADVIALALMMENLL